ncbi:MULTISPECIES: hypothetical protein [Geminicoccus]|uniref:hypothetical protein n=1 Tax=Geminicoccus TaxID=489140 RepID=UPI00135CEBA5|nr:MULTISPECIES: hypothetical protein [Geminicoccus]
MQQNIKVRSGNRIVVRFDGKEIGLIQNVSMNDDYAPEPASGVGDIHVAEWVPTMARHTLNVSAMVLRRGAMLEAGIAMENGDAVLQGLVFDFESYDKDTGDLLRKYMGCSYASGSIEIQKHAITVQQAVFNALDVSGLAA